MRYKVEVAYDGYDFYGWQKQANLKTIQGLIEHYLSKICDEEIEIVASGRTDRYVHALGQVFHFDTKLVMDTNKWIYALNNFLPKSIRILKFEIANDHFHARFDVESKVYRYIYTYDVQNPFIYKYKSFLKNRVDITKMQLVAQLLQGTHDFTSFTSAKIDERKSKIRTIYRIDIIENHDDIILEFHGNGFLRYMVRILSQVLIEVGLNNLSYDDVKTMLELKDKDSCRYKADGHGLYLVSINYKGDL